MLSPRSEPSSTQSCAAALASDESPPAHGPGSQQAGTIANRLSVTRGCPLLGLVSKKNIISCHAPAPPPPTLRYARVMRAVPRGLSRRDAQTVTPFAAMLSTLC